MNALTNSIVTDVHKGIWRDDSFDIEKRQLRNKLEEEYPELLTGEMSLKNVMSRAGQHVKATRYYLPLFLIVINIVLMFDLRYADTTRRRD